MAHRRSTHLGRGGAPLFFADAECGAGPGPGVRLGFRASLLAYGESAQQPAESASSWSGDQLSGAKPNPNTHDLWDGKRPSEFKPHAVGRQKAVRFRCETLERASLS
jgi:hypothetical protein